MITHRNCLEDINRAIQAHNLIMKAFKEEQTYEVFLKDRSDRGSDFYGTITASSKLEAVEKLQKEIDIDFDIAWANMREINE